MDSKITEEYGRGYRHGYTAGYQAGVEAALGGYQKANVAEDISLLPIQAMEITNRAKNCLRNAGYKSIGDIIALEDRKVKTMKNMGKVIGKEIAIWLDNHGMLYTVWNQFI